MLFHRTRSWLIVLAAILGAATNARGQAPESARGENDMPPPGTQPDHDQILQPFGPVDRGDIKDMQLFAPVEFDRLDGFSKGAVGPFFKYERLYWSIHQPSFAQVGSTDPEIVALGLNENTNQFITANFVWGNRFDIGYRMCDGSGWVTSIVKSNTEFSGALDVTNTTTVGFFDPTGVLPANALQALVGVDLTGVPFPPLAAESFIPYNPLILQNSSRFVGIDLLKSIRYEPEHHGGIWEMFFGPRFFQFHDRFNAQGTTAIQSFSQPDGVIILPQTPPNVVSIARVLTTTSAPNFWDLGIDNNIVGPEIGTRWSLERERWTVSADFRALLGANYQNEHLSGALSSGYSTHLIRLDTGATISPNAIVGTLGSALFNFNSANHNVTFAPLGEARFDATYKVTKNVSIEAGYTAILATGISRASDRIIYNVPNMGILANGADKQHVFINGVNVGFNVNY
jgi:Putative beta barrel porin-7 (BBP7)